MSRYKIMKSISIAILLLFSVLFFVSSQSSTQATIRIGKDGFISSEVMLQ